MHHIIHCENLRGLPPNTRRQSLLVIVSYVRNQMKKTIYIYIYVYKKNQASQLFSRVMKSSNLQNKHKPLGTRTHTVKKRHLWGPLDLHKNNLQTNFCVSSLKQMWLISLHNLKRRISKLVPKRHDIQTIGKTKC